MLDFGFYNMDCMEGMVANNATVEAEAARQNINNVLGINAKWDDVPDDIPF